LGYEGLVLDVTERKRAEEALCWNEERYRSLALATAQIVWAFDPQGRAIDDLPLWRAFTGQSIEEIRRGAWGKALHPEDREGVLTFIEGKGLRALGFSPVSLVGQSVFALFHDSPPVMEHHRRALAGEEGAAVVEMAGRAFESKYTPLRDRHGRVTGLISV